jgi:spore coat polysaccharide biosynthesis protein SpsF (cytidylyltransferase family)
MQECLARWYVNASIDQREKYLAALYKQKGWEIQLASLKDVIRRLELPIPELKK